MRRAPQRETPAALRAKVAFLRRVDAYPEGTRRVELRETHFSWVFLTDRHAYKLKKPVRFAALDYRSPQARRLNCRREVRLNRRLAPDVYLGVVALTRDARGDLRLGGRGRRMDWLVKMRRLPASRTLEHAIAAGRVRDADLRRIAARLAEFYRTARPVAIGADAYRRRFVLGVHAHRRYLARPAFGLPSDAVEAPAEMLLRFLRDRGELLAQRVRARRIVEGHGDLRPEHIYLGTPPLIVDCLEFDRALRTLDPVEELAFLALECERLGAPPVGARMLRAWRHAVADRPPPALFEFHMAWRAYRRAVAAASHLDGPDAAHVAKWRRRARQYLRLAALHARRLAPLDA